MRAIVYSPRQVGNPLIKELQDVPVQQGDKSMKADFEVFERCGVLFLSVRYNNLHPEYIYKRVDILGKMYELRILLVHADVENPTDALSQLTKFCIYRNLTLVVIWSYAEGAVYLSSLKRKSQASQNVNEPLKIQKKQASTHEEQLCDVLTKVPRVNKPDVLGLERKFKSFRGIVKNAEKVDQLEGWGPTKSSAFKRALNEPFSGSNPLSQ